MRGYLQFGVCEQRASEQYYFFNHMTGNQAFAQALLMGYVHEGERVLCLTYCLRP